MDTLHTLFYFSVAIAVLVAFHEFGHYWVARLAGVKVLRFSIGFGKKLWAYQKTPEQTEFVLSAVPLGGYVKMVDEREGEVKPEDLPYAFNRQSVGVRTAIVMAGPLANLLLAVTLFWLVLIIGETGLKPVVGNISPDSLAYEAGFEVGDEIIAVNQKSTPTWSLAFDELFSLAIDGAQDIVVDVKAGDGSQKFRVLKFASADLVSPDVLNSRLGLQPWMPKIKPIIGKLLDGGVAKQVGLQVGDLIVSADNRPIADWQQWVEYVQARPDKEITVLLERNDVQTSLQLTPIREEPEDGKVVGKIGAGPLIPDNLMQDLQVEYSMSPLAAVPVALNKTWFYSVSTLKMIGKMFIGAASVENLSGPISIAQYAGQSAEVGFTAFLKFLALVSVSLGVLNLLPVPVLDGGHLLFYFIEFIKGSPVPDKMQWYFQQIGMFLLMSLMTLALFLDLDRLFQ
ncbi:MULTISPECIES: RIP metalloprotease RseP [Methylomonas]|uniref:RIP metalloprotease RseP n=1 Tax=Methylomonas TaxID=416 RepID=UPI0012319DFE|nr:RIP metalloprotease RseP [Methylomonas rhizoryzae]